MEQPYEEEGAQDPKEQEQQHVEQNQEEEEEEKQYQEGEILASSQEDLLPAPATQNNGLPTPEPPATPKLGGSMENDNAVPECDPDEIIRKIHSKTMHLNEKNIARTLGEISEEVGEVHKNIPGKKKRQVEQALDALLESITDICKDEADLRIFLEACPNIVIKGCQCQLREHLAWLQANLDKPLVSMEPDPEHLLLSNEVSDFCTERIREVQPPSNQMSKIDDTRDRIERALKSRFHKAQLYVFGSCAGDVSTKTSDIDLYMDIPEVEASLSLAKATAATSKMELRKMEQTWAHVTSLLAEKKKMVDHLKVLQKNLEMADRALQLVQTQYQETLSALSAVREANKAETESQMASQTCDSNEQGESSDAAANERKKLERAKAAVHTVACNNLQRRELKESKKRLQIFEAQYESRVEQIDAKLSEDDCRTGQRELSQAHAAFKRAQTVLAQESRVIYRVGQCLQRNGFLRIQAIARARVPVVKFVDPVFGFEVDICLNNRIAGRNTALLRSYLRIDERVRSVVFLVKGWTKARGISDSTGGTLSSYGWVILVVHFFQQIGILPNLQSDEAAALISAPRVVCSDVDATFMEDVSLGAAMLPRKEVPYAESISTASAGILFRGFLSYFATSFDWIRSVAAIHTQDFAVQNKWEAKGPTKLWRLAVEDPFESFDSPRPHDLGSVVSKLGALKMYNEVQRAHAMAVTNSVAEWEKIFEPGVSTKKATKKYASGKNNKVNGRQQPAVVQHLPRGNPMGRSRGGGPGRAVAPQGRSFGVPPPPPSGDGTATVRGRGRSYGRGGWRGRGGRNRGGRGRNANGRS